MTGQDDQANRKEPRARKAAAGPIPPDLQAQLGRRLKSLYQDVLSEPIPDRFTHLLEQLDAGKKRPSGGDTG